MQKVVNLIYMINEINSKEFKAKFTTLYYLKKHSKAYAETLVYNLLIQFKEIYLNLF